MNSTGQEPTRISFDLLYELKMGSTIEFTPVQNDRAAMEIMCIDGRYYTVFITPEGIKTIKNPTTMLVIPMFGFKANVIRDPERWKK